jgi:hypothetical protein
MRGLKIAKVALSSPSQPGLQVVKRVEGEDRVAKFLELRCRKLDIWASLVDSGGFVTAIGILKTAAQSAATIFRATPHRCPECGALPKAKELT